MKYTKENIKREIRWNNRIKDLWISAEKQLETQYRSMKYKNNKRR